MEIKHDLLPKQKTRKHNLGVEIDLYPYATELYQELDRIGIIVLWSSFFVTLQPNFCHRAYAAP